MQGVRIMAESSLSSWIKELKTAFGEQLSARRRRRLIHKRPPLTPRLYIEALETRLAPTAGLVESIARIWPPGDTVTFANYMVKFAQPVPNLAPSDFQLAVIGTVTVGSIQVSVD